MMIILANEYYGYLGAAIILFALCIGAFLISSHWYEHRAKRRAKQEKDAAHK